MKKSYSVFSLALAVMLAGCSDQPVTQVQLTNPSDDVRVDQAIVLTRKKLRAVDNDNMVPVLKNQFGEYIPCQVDDMDMDGSWDELATVYTFSPNEKVMLKVEWIAMKEYPSFPVRTNIRYGKLVAPGNVQELKTDMHGKEDLERGTERPYPYQMDGPAWENDKAGFRHYFDGRNCRDYFGKTVSYMALDSTGIKDDGYPGDTYHVMRAWGRDVMSAAQSFGLGGLAMKTPTSLVRLGVKRNETIDNIDSTRFTNIFEGPIRSMLRLDYYGWDVDGQKIDLTNWVTIWAGKYGYENKVVLSKLPKGCQLVTGIVNNFNNEPEELEEYEDKIMGMITHDKQTYNKEWYMGMALLIPKTNFGSTFQAPKTGEGVTTVWSVALKACCANDYNYNVYAAWELSDPRFIERDYFEDMIEDYAQEMAKPIQVSFN